MHKTIAILLLVLSVGTLQAQTQAGKGKDAPARSEQEKDITRPEVSVKVDPVYPQEAKKEKVQGDVIIDAVVDADGKVTEAKVTNDPDPRLAKAALDAVKQWKFKPARNKSGKPVLVKTTLTVRFRLY